jgi:hypothetical protein
MFDGGDLFDSIQSPQTFSSTRYYRDTVRLFVDQKGNIQGEANAIDVSRLLKRKIMKCPTLELSKERLFRRERDKNMYHMVGVL